MQVALVNIPLNGWHEYETLILKGSVEAWVAWCLAFPPNHLCEQFRVVGDELETMVVDLCGTHGDKHIIHHIIAESEIDQLGWSKFLSVFATDRPMDRPLSSNVSGFLFGASGCG